MDKYVVRKRPRLTSSATLVQPQLQHHQQQPSRTDWTNTTPRPADQYQNASTKNVHIKADIKADAAGPADADSESTDVKLALLASLHPTIPPDVLLDALVLSDGTVDAAARLLADQRRGWSQGQNRTRRQSQSQSGSAHAQTSLAAFVRQGNSSGEDERAGAASDRKRRDGVANDGDGREDTVGYGRYAGFSPAPARPLRTLRGRTLHLYTPAEIAANTPCTLIHPFLAAVDADALLRELLSESDSFRRLRYQMFGRIVESGNAAAMFVAEKADADAAKARGRMRPEHESGYEYAGSEAVDVRVFPPPLRAASIQVEQAVHTAIADRIRTRQPGGRRLPHQAVAEAWRANVAVVSLYATAADRLGWHADEPTYLGPQAVIGSLSLGVGRQFRVRRVVPPEWMGGPTAAKQTGAPDLQGQVAIHLPHNSLLVMHAGMQEEWKHSVCPVPNLTPHPISGTRRINITYRWYRDSLHPRFTPRCHCGRACILRCVQRKQETRGRYMWVCAMGYVQDRKACSFFQWAEFDDKGDPIWK